jgi:hypothetical protein
MGRPPLEKKQQQLTVALPPEIRSLLEDAAVASNRSLAEEIRQRIDQTITVENYDPVTREMISGLLSISERLREDFGTDWHSDPRTHKAFMEAVAQRLAAYAPPPSKPNAATADIGLIRPTDSPETIGRMRENDDRRDGLYEHLNAALERRGKHKMTSFARRINVKGRRS